MTPEPNDIAKSTLEFLLIRATERLSNLSQPAFVAACPNRFDDTGRYPGWLAVQVARATWEQDDYSGEYGLLDGERPKHIDEKAFNREDTQIARDVLAWLQDADWRSLTERALGFKFDTEALALGIQDGAQWFIVSASNGGADRAYVLDPSGRLHHVGRPERFDLRIGETRPLKLETIDPDAWPSLQRAAPLFPLPALKQGDAAAEARSRLSALLSGAALVLSRLPGRACYIATAAATGLYGSYHGIWRCVATDGFTVGLGGWQDVEQNYRDRLQRAGGPALALDALISELEAGKWRDLFTKGVMSLGRRDSLGILMRDDGCWLVAAQMAVFAIEQGTIKLAGVCDGATEGSVVDTQIHLLDETSLAF